MVSPMVFLDFGIFTRDFSPCPRLMTSEEHRYTPKQAVRCAALRWAGGNGWGFASGKWAPEKPHSHLFGWKKIIFLVFFDFEPVKLNIVLLMECGWTPKICFSSTIMFQFHFIVFPCGIFESSLTMTITSTPPTHTSGVFDSVTYPFDSIFRLTYVKRKESI